MAVAVGPAAGSGGADADQLSIENESTDSAVPAERSHGSQDTSVNESNESAAFSMDADVVERCGIRCRTVTANLTNTGNATAENTTVTIVMSAGESVVWQERYQLGNVSENESVERTDTIEISGSDAFSVTRNRGRITVTVTVDWDDGETTFRERRQVV